MQIVVQCRETIRPSSATPHHLRNLKLSLLDQLQYAVASPNPHILLFYSAHGDVHRFQSTNMSFLLKKSLSATLTEFYPLAGRLSNDQPIIDCNDGGVELIEARVKAPFVLDQLLSCPNAEELYQLYPPDTAATGGLCTVQVTIFEGCGGMVIGVCTSHAIGDVSALSLFVNSWSAIARGDKIVSPKFGFADVLPPRDLAACIPNSIDNKGTQQEILKPVQKLITKRFVLNKSEIAALRADCANQSPTRVQVACALIFKCLISVVVSKSSKPVFLNMPISLSPKMSPPLPPHYFGNLAWSSFSTEITEPESFRSLVGQVSKITRKVDSDYVKNILADSAELLFSNIQQDLEFFLKNEVHLLGISSLCRFPFYEADFGWGRPMWAAFFLSYENYVTLLDTKNGDGVEAWVTLNNQDMTKFESEYDLLLREFSAAGIRARI